MNPFPWRAEKIMSRIIRLSQFSEESGSITRPYGTRSFREAALQVKSWMEEAGLQTKIDVIGNVRGRKTGMHSNGKTFIIGSHIDSVVNAGKFDGPLGIIMGLEIIQNLDASKLPFDIELIAFCDEEGVRFHTTYLGSKLVAGNFEESLLEKKDANGISLKEVIMEMGGDISLIRSEALDPANCLAYFEMHIEQGPILFEKNIPAAVVTGIAGQLRASLIFKGEAGHAGTVPYPMRRDALAAAADVIVMIESFAKAGEKFLATVGTLEVLHAASNVIPGEVSFTLDLRCADASLLGEAAETIKNASASICKKRNIDFEWQEVQQTAPVKCDEGLVEALETSIAGSGSELVKLVSGAGHDAVAMSAITPICMMFVRCYKGISHNPLEDVELKDIAASLEIAERFLANQIKMY